jgi:protein involved in temperature-dependent protein secretion
MPKHFQHKDDKATKADEVRLLLTEMVGDGDWKHIENGLQSLTNMSSNDLGNLVYYLNEVRHKKG